MQLPAVSEELARALRARGPKRPSVAVETGRRGRFPTPRSVNVEAERGAAAGGPPSVHVVGPAVAPVPSGPTRPSAHDPRFEASDPARANAGVAVDHAALAPVQPSGPAVAPEGIGAYPPHASPHFAEPRHAQVFAPMAPPARGFEHPLAIGALLLVAPPIGLSLLWASRAYGREAKIALTGFSAMMVVLAAAFGLVMLAR